MSDDMSLANSPLAGGFNGRTTSVKARSGGTKKLLGGVSRAKSRRRAVQSTGSLRVVKLAPGVHTLLGDSVVAAWTAEPETEFAPLLQQVQASLRELGNPTAQGLLVLPHGTELWRYAQQVEQARQAGVYVRLSPSANTAQGAAALLKALNTAGKASAAHLKAFTAQLQPKR